MARTLHSAAWRAHCTAQHGAHTAQRSMVRTLHSAAWRTHCTAQHGAHTAQCIMAHTLHSAAWRAHCTAQHGAHTAQRSMVHTLHSAGWRAHCTHRCNKQRRFGLGREPTCPWPSETMLSRAVMPMFSASESRYAVGSAPDESTNTIGVSGFESSYAACRRRALQCTHTRTHARCARAAVPAG